jgi:hypothetical protein
MSMGGGAVTCDNRQLSTDAWDGDLISSDDDGKISNGGGRIAGVSVVDGYNLLPHRLPQRSVR